ncbi:MAG TPA: hypothetical protein VEI26_12725 [Terriglobales bacterium]|nr:hypothetical protein [Terriglobales bacterium]
MGWVWQGVFTSILAALLWAGGATVLTFIKHRWPDYGSLALYWLGSAVVIGALWFVVTGHPPLMAFPPQVTAENIAENIKMWAENLGLAIAKQTAPGDISFVYTVTSRDGWQIAIARSTKDKPNYIEFGTSIAAPPDIQALLSTITQEQKQTLTDEIGAELNQGRIGFSFSTLTPVQVPGNPITSPQVSVMLEEGIRISELNEQKFSQTLDDINFTANFVKLRTKLILQSMNAAKSTTTTGKSVTQN